MYCEHCGGALTVGARFCGACGAAMPVQPPLSPPPLPASASASTESAAAHPNRTVSRSHLVITPSAGGVRVTDVSGHNGTVVTGADGAEQRLRGTSIELSTPSQLALGALSVWLQPA